MFRQTERKINIDKITPNITGELIAEMIAAYHALKLQQGGKYYKIFHRDSQFIHALEDFYVSIKNKKERLNSQACLQLAKILYIDDHKSGGKSHYIKTRFLQFFDLSVIAALSASAAHVDHLSDHFAAMCESPKDAANIAYAVLNLKNHIHAIKKANIGNPLFTEKLYLQMSTQPEIAQHIVAAYQSLLNYNESNEPIGLLKKDRMVYLLVVSKQKSELTDEKLASIKRLNIHQLDAAIKEITADPDQHGQSLDSAPRRNNV